MEVTSVPSSSLADFLAFFVLFSADSPLKRINFLFSCRPPPPPSRLAFRVLSSLLASFSSASLFRATPLPCLAQAAEYQTKENGGEKAPNSNTQIGEA